MARRNQHRQCQKILESPYGNLFTLVASSKSGTSTTDAIGYALEKIVSAPGAASSGGTVVNKADNGSGAIATFKAASTTTLALSGSAATNYTVTSATGSVTIIAKPLTITAA